jgi:hypothetical protein
MELPISFNGFWRPVEDADINDPSALVGRRVAIMHHLYLPLLPGKVGLIGKEQLQRQAKILLAWAVID